MADTLSADALSPVVAQHGRGVVGPAAALQVVVVLEVVDVALARGPEEVCVALADAAAEGTMEVALGRSLAIRLQR